MPLSPWVGLALELTMPWDQLRKDSNITGQLMGLADQADLSPNLGSASPLSVWPQAELHILSEPQRPQM